MYNSKYYLKKAMQERMKEILLHAFFTILFLLVILSIVVALDMLYYSLFSLNLITISFLIFNAGTSYTKTSYFLKKSGREFKKERLIAEFNESLSYYRYAKTKTSDVGEFIKVMNMMVKNFDELNNLVVFDSALSELSCSDNPNEVITYFLMNPGLLEGQTDSITSRIHKFNRLLKQYPYAKEPCTVSRSNRSTNMVASRRQLHDVSDELSSILRNIVVNYEKPTITDIDEFSEYVISNNIN